MTKYHALTLSVNYELNNFSSFVVIEDSKTIFISTASDISEAYYELKQFLNQYENTFIRGTEQLEELNERYNVKLTLKKTLTHLPHTRIPNPETSPVLVRRKHNRKRL